MEQFPVLAWAALSAGLLGSPHCAGMCGGLVSAFGYSIQSQSAKKFWLFTLLYHLGRLASYAFLGLLAGLAGHFMAGILQPTPLPRIIIAATLILLGLSMLGSGSLVWMEKQGARLWTLLAPLRKPLFPINRAYKALLIGLLWGFLPCGLVYSALLTSTGAGNPLYSAALMVLFGLGTMPILLATSSASQKVKHLFKRYHLRTLNGIFLIGCGIWILVPVIQHASQGMNHSHPVVAPPDAVAPAQPADRIDPMEHMKYMQHNH